MAIIVMVLILSVAQGVNYLKTRTRGRHSLETFLLFSHFLL